MSALIVVIIVLVLLGLLFISAYNRLVALRQNVEESSADVARHRGSTVLLAWQRRHTIRLSDNTPNDTASNDNSE